MLAVAASGRVQPLRPGSLLTVLNSGGSRTPLFWCFNAPSAEHTALAEQLGGEQPLYGSFSGVGVLQWNKKHPGDLGGNVYPRDSRRATSRAVQDRGQLRRRSRGRRNRLAPASAAWMSNDCV